MVSTNIDKAQINIGGFTLDHVSIDSIMEYDYGDRISGEFNGGGFFNGKYVEADINVVCNCEEVDLISTHQKADKLTTIQYPRKLKSKKKRIRKKWNKKYSKTYLAYLKSFTPFEGVEYDGMTTDINFEIEPC